MVLTWITELNFGGKGWDMILHFHMQTISVMPHVLYAEFEWNSYPHLEESEKTFNTDVIVLRCHKLGWANASGDHAKENVCMDELAWSGDRSWQCEKIHKMQPIGISHNMVGVVF